jgi:uncharacterized protein (TIGR03435 family)
LPLDRDPFGIDAINARPVVIGACGFHGSLDKTGLQGTYDVALEWEPEQAGDLNGPSLFTALKEQLGLRLESQKGRSKCS